MNDGKMQGYSNTVIQYLMYNAVCRISITQAYIIFTSLSLLRAEAYLSTFR